MSKINKKDIIYLFIITFLLFLSIFTIVLNKENLKSIDEINSKNIETTNKYTNIVKENEEDMLSFLSENLLYNFVPMSSLDYIFRETFEGLTEEGKAYLYSLYYSNLFRYQDLYIDLLETPEYNNYLINFISENEDINNPEVYEKIEIIPLRVIIEELRANHLYIYKNGNYIEVFFDFTWFLDEFSDILDEDYKNFIELDKFSQTAILSPERAYIDLNVLTSMIYKAETYLENSNNEYLKSYAFQHLQTALNIYTCTDTSNAFYLEDETFTVSNDLLNHYDEYIEKYPDSNISPLLKEVEQKIKEIDGNGYPVSFEVGEIVNSFYIEKGYTTEEFLNQYELNDDISNEEIIEELNNY